jgi:hypothetical protein
MVVDQGLPLVAITEWNTRQFMRMTQLNLSFTSVIIREDIIALGTFYRSVVLARLRYQRATIIIDGGTHICRSFYPMLLFFVDVGGAVHTEFCRLLEYSRERATAERICK